MRTSVTEARIHTRSFSRSHSHSSLLLHTHTHTHERTFSLSHSLTKGTSTQDNLSAHTQKNSFVSVSSDRLDRHKQKKPKIFCRAKKFSKQRRPTKISRLRIKQLPLLDGKSSSCRIPNSFSALLSHFYARLRQK